MNQNQIDTNLLIKSAIDLLLSLVYTVLYGQHLPSFSYFTVISRVK